MKLYILEWRWFSLCHHSVGFFFGKLRKFIVSGSTFKKLIGGSNNGVHVPEHEESPMNDWRSTNRFWHCRSGKSTFRPSNVSLGDFRVQVSDPRGRNPSETLERKIWDYGFLGLGPNQRTTDISETEWTFLRKYRF